MSGSASLYATKKKIKTKNYLKFSLYRMLQSQHYILSYKIMTVVTTITIIEKKNNFKLQLFMLEVQGGRSA